MKTQAALNWLLLLLFFPLIKLWQYSIFYSDTWAELAKFAPGICYCTDINIQSL